MNRLRHISLLCLAALLSGCTAKVIVTPVPVQKAPHADGSAAATKAPKAPMDGVFYTLPRTVLKVDQPIERIELKKGKYPQFVALFFPRFASDDIVDENLTIFKVAKATVSASGEPDPDQIYFVKTTGGGPIDRKAKLEYAESGAVSGASASADNVTIDIALSVISAAAGVASRAFGGGGMEEIAELKCEGESAKTIPCLIKAFKVDDGGPVPTDFKSRLFRSYADLTPEKMKELDAFVKNDTTGSFEGALRAYFVIYSLSGTRESIRNQPSGLSVEVQLKDIDAAIASEMAFGFVGSVKKDTWTLSTELRPRTLSDSPVLAKVNKFKGICFLSSLPTADQPPKKFRLLEASYLCGASDLLDAKWDLERRLAAAQAAGNPEEVNAITQAIEKSKKTIELVTAAASDAKDLKAKFDLDPGTGQTFQTVDSAFSQSGERGFRYRLPAATKVSIELDGTGPVSGNKQMIAQFGSVVSLPASTGGRKMSYDLKFFEATGALKSIEVSSTAIIQKSVVDSVAKDAFATADKATDETGRLKRQLELISARDALAKKCKELNLPCGGNTQAGNSGTTQPQQ